MTDYERMLRQLAVSDERLVASLLAQDDPAVTDRRSCEQTRPLFQLAALIAIGGTPASYQAVVDSALAAGAGVQDIVEVLLAVVGTVGSARVVAAAPLLARAVGFDVDEAFDIE